MKMCFQLLILEASSHGSDVKRVSPDVGYSITMVEELRSPTRFDTSRKGKLGKVPKELVDGSAVTASTSAERSSQ